MTLDFSAAPLTAAQRSWLVAATRPGAAYAASFHQRENRFWEGPLLVFPSRQARALKQLRGLPQRCLTSEGPGSQLDLAQSAITLLGLQCPADPGQWHEAGHLAAARMPKALELISKETCCVYPMWSRAPGGDSPGFSASLRARVGTGRPEGSSHRVYAELGWPGVSLLVTPSLRGNIAARLHARGSLFHGQALHVRTDSLTLLGTSEERWVGSFFTSGVQEVHLAVHPRSLFLWIYR